jgi:hypothetical protein
MKKKFTGALCLVLKKGSRGLPRLNITSIEPTLATLNPGERFRDTHLSFPDRFHLSATEDESSFKGVRDIIITTRPLISGYFFRHDT